MSIPSIFDYLPEHAENLMKYAEDHQQHGSVLKQNLKTLGKGLVGLGVGSAAGLGMGVMADMLHEKVTGKPISNKTIGAIAPILGAAAGITYNIFKSKQDEEMKRAIENQAGRTSRSVPR
jgi:hypothetical protein